MSRILFVDDDSMILRMTAFIAKKGGFEALGTSSGEECIEVLKREKPDMVFIDVEMPGLSGLDTLRKIRDDSSIADARVCLMTGTMTDELRENAAELGAVGVIEKPIQAAEVLSLVGQ